jgi:hypothetical protein
MSQELRPSSCLLFIPQYEYGEPRWNDVAGETPDSSTRALWQSYQRNNLVAKREKLVKYMMNLALRSSFFHTLKRSLPCYKILGRGADSFTSPPPKARRAEDFYRPWPGLKPRILDPMANILTVTQRKNTS